MLKKSIAILLLAAIVACQPDKRAQKLDRPAYADIINKEFTGDLAFETTAFVEQYWRIAGNTGFNTSIDKIATQMEESGYIKEERATAEDRLTYRIEKRPLKSPTWEPVDATVKIHGETMPLLVYANNRNMVAINSYSTPKEGITAEVVHIKDIRKLNPANLEGKIVFAEVHPWAIFKTVIVEGGAAGLLTYNNPKYLQPEKNTTSIQFRQIPLDTVRKPWAIALSYAAKERLKEKLEKGKVTLQVNVETKIYPSEELTVVADVKGSKTPKERLVFSAHVQEPGANDNASGVGVALEMASLTAKLIKEKRLDTKRTLTFLWGDEIISTRRYVKEDSIRAKDIKWGISLDMVGEDTEKTGGTFLIEKMPDPSAIWTRGNDKHTEWGGKKMKLSQMTPHYLNDFLIDIFLEQGKRANWTVNTNPFEGGSDHVPFLRADIPSVLFWHFTDQFYHTDNDRIDKVSKATLKNVGTAALVAAYSLLNADETTARYILKTTEKAAVNRLNEELKQSKLALNKGDSLKTQIAIMSAWKDWYVRSVSTISDLVKDPALLQSDIESAQKLIDSVYTIGIQKIRKD